MKIRGNKKWFSLIFTLFAGTIFLTLISTISLRYLEVDKQLYISYKKIQAANYAAEWLELAKWYIYTSVNQNKIDWWKNKISNMAGKYIISYNNWYTIKSWENEIIELNEPYVVDYTRTIEITSWNTSNEKNIISTVDYGESNKVQFTTTITNLNNE